MHNSNFQPKCEHNSCDQPVYGAHTLCYFHRKMEKGLFKKEDRSVYLRSKVEETYAKCTDKMHVSIEERLCKIYSPAAKLVHKYVSFNLYKQFKLSPKEMFSDINILIMLDSNFPPESLEKYAQKLVGNLKDYYKSSTKYKKYETPLECAMSLECAYTPESILIKEEEDQLQAKSEYIAYKIMTNMERKVCKFLRKGDSEQTISYRLCVSKQRVNTLKQRAICKIKTIHDRIGKEKVCGTFY